MAPHIKDAKSGEQHFLCQDTMDESTYIFDLFQELSVHFPLRTSTSFCETLQSTSNYYSSQKARFVAVRK